MFVGSDAIALAPMTDKITYLEEGDCAVLTRETVDIYDESGARVARESRTINTDATRVDKAGYKHFMAKEIAEQPTVLADAMRAYLDGNRIALPDTLPDFAKIDRLTMVACGTAFYACLTAKYWFEQIAQMPVEVDIASEFRYREPPITPRTVALFVSQSGETADTLAALRYCKGRADSILSVVNVAESSIARESDVALPIHAGVEVGVASTKAFTCQLNTLLLLALHAAVQRGVMTQDALAEKLAQLRALPGLFNVALDRDPTMADAAHKIAEARDVLFLGRGLMLSLIHI